MKIPCSDPTPFLVRLLLFDWALDTRTHPPAFTAFDWAAYSEPAYEPSEFVQLAMTYVRATAPLVAPRLTAAYQTYFYNQLAQALLGRFSAAMFGVRSKVRCERAGRSEERCS